MDRINRSGDLFFTHTKLDGKLTLRMSIGQTARRRRVGQDPRRGRRTITYRSREP
jgi:hypothetical protein